jgi:hypothetical protein
MPLIIETWAQSINDQSVLDIGAFESNILTCTACGHGSSCVPGWTFSIKGYLGRKAHAGRAECLTQYNCIRGTERYNQPSVQILRRACCLAVTLKATAAYRRSVMVQSTQSPATSP